MVQYDATGTNQIEAQHLVATFVNGLYTGTVLYTNFDISYPEFVYDKIVTYKFWIRNIKIFVDDSNRYNNNFTCEDGKSPA